ncbi:hypothetical protein [Mesorhizobium sp. M0859]
MKPEKLFPAIRPDRRRVPDQEGKAALVAKILISVKVRSTQGPSSSAT